MNSKISVASILLFLLMFTYNPLTAQKSNTMYRIAKIKVDSTQLDQYKLALHEQMNAAMKLEPGVLSYTAVSNKNDATIITIFEVYANLDAYQSHILTAHFKKYKETVKDMVLSLELIDTDLVVRAKKTNYYKRLANLQEVQPFNFMIVTHLIIAL